jgi:hypothetical protein
VVFVIHKLLDGVVESVFVLLTLSQLFVMYGLAFVGKNNNKYKQLRNGGG